MVNFLSTKTKYIANYNVFDLNLTSDILNTFTRNNNHKGSLLVSDMDKERLFNAINNLTPIINKGEIYLVNYFETNKDFSKIIYVELIDTEGNLIKLNKIKEDLFTEYKEKELQ